MMNILSLVVFLQREGEGVVPSSVSGDACSPKSVWCVVASFPTRGIFDSTSLTCTRLLNTSRVVYVLAFSRIKNICASIMCRFMELHHARNRANLALHNRQMYWTCYNRLYLLVRSDFMIPQWIIDLGFCNQHNCRRIWLHNKELKFQVEFPSSHCRKDGHGQIYRYFFGVVCELYILALGRYLL